MASARPLSEEEARGRAQGERIQAYCRIIWGSCDYDLDIQCDYSSYPTYYCSVCKDFGDAFGPPLTMTGICSSEEQAWRELERMLRVWARQVMSGQPMTKEQELEIFSGPNGQNRWVLERWHEELEKREGKTEMG
jgi:hypothetical protein